MPHFPLSRRAKTRWYHSIHNDAALSTSIVLQCGRGLPSVEDVGWGSFLVQALTVNKSFKFEEGGSAVALPFQHSIKVVSKLRKTALVAHVRFNC